MPFIHHKSPSSSPTRHTATPTTVSPDHSSDMQLKGVKRIVSGLRRRMSHISLRGHRRSSVSEDAHPFPLILNVVPDDHHPITFPASPRTHSSDDTLSRRTSAGGIDKRLSYSDGSSLSSSTHSRSSSPTGSSYHEARSQSGHQVESSSPGSSPGKVPSQPEGRRSISRLSLRFPPPQSLTAPLEALIIPFNEPEPSLAQRNSIVSLEPLTAPLENLVLSSNEIAVFAIASDEAVVSSEQTYTVVDPLRVPLPPLEPWELPLPPLEPCDIALPDEDEDLESLSIPASPVSLGVLAVSLGGSEEHIYIEDPCILSPPSLNSWEVPVSQEDLEPPLVDEQLGSDPIPDSPRIIPHMDPLGVTQSEPSALAEGGAFNEPLSSTLDSQLSTSMEMARETPLVSPPAPVDEPEVPNPFIEDPDIGSSEDVSEGTMHSTPSAEDIALAPPQTTVPTPRSPNFNKSVPPTPALPSDDEDEEEVPELYLPGLILPTMFLPIPNTDSLSTLLTKYIPPEKRPPRDLTGDYARMGGEMHPLVMTNSWRAIARQARDRIVEADPEEVSYILSLWYLRLSSLARMRLFNQTSAECTNLFTVLHAIEPPETQVFLFDHMLPFELEVLYAKLKYWAGDHMGYLDALAALLQRCKSKARAAKTDQAASAMWTERGSRVCLIIASQLIEMKDFAAAAKLLEPLCLQHGNITSPALRSAVARVYLQGGYIAMAAKRFAAVAEDPTADPTLKCMNAALFASAEGDWQRATNELQKIVEADPENFVAINNLAVAYLNQGKLREGIEVLENALRTSPATIVTAEPFLFNLSTLYELRSASGADKKRELLVEVAKWAGDGLRTTCLKMPTN